MLIFTTVNAKQLENMESKFNFKLGKETIEFVLTINKIGSSWNIATPALNGGCVMNGWFEENGRVIIFGSVTGAVQLFAEQLKSIVKKEVPKQLK